MSADVAGLNLISNEMTVEFNVFSPLMEYWIFRNMDSSLVVTV
jgi:hypothetical protein